jgi:NADP-dependent 3-hydroxy acid dehydrogenase YdfG
MLLLLLLQVENEYGYYGGSKPYLRHLADTIRQHMGEQVRASAVEPSSSSSSLVNSCCRIV